MKSVCQSNQEVWSTLKYTTILYNIGGSTLVVINCLHSQDFFKLKGHICSSTLLLLQLYIFVDIFDFMLIIFILLFGMKNMNNVATFLLSLSSACCNPSIWICFWVPLLTLFCRFFSNSSTCTVNNHCLKHEQLET